MARPTILTPKLQAEILANVRFGLHIETVIEASGFSVQTWYNWIEQAKNGKEPFVSFVEALKEAEQVAEKESLAIVKQAGPGWQAHAWFLERRFASRYGRRDPDYQVKRNRLEAETDLLRAKLKEMEAGKAGSDQTINVLLPALED